MAKRWSSTDRNLPIHMRSLQPCKCLKENTWDIWDSKKYPNQDCKVCGGAGSYIPKYK
jgi:hypothetical protein